jgi:hypothetical protein
VCDSATIVSFHSLPPALSRLLDGDSHDPGQPAGSARRAGPPAARRRGPAASEAKNDWRLLGSYSGKMRFHSKLRTSPFLVLVSLVGPTFAIRGWHQSHMHHRNDRLDPRLPSCELEECFLNSTELISYNGYRPETHLCITEDGYLLNLHRILNISEAERSSGPTILLLHGLLDSSATFLINGREGSLGFLLAGEGFDVWLGNSRGNRYSLSHESIPPSNLEFWDWSWDALAR